MALLSGRRGVGVLRATQPTLREPVVAQSAHAVRSALRCTCRLSRNGGLRDRYASDGNWELGAGLRVPCLSRRQPYPTRTHLPSRTLALPRPCCHPRCSPCHCNFSVLSGSPLSASCNVLPTPHRGCLAPKGPPPSDYVQPPSAAGPRLLPSASLEYGPSSLSFHSPEVSAGGAAVVAAHEAALLGMRGLYYNRASRSLLNADSLPTPAHPMVASSASPLSTDTYGSTAAAAAASRAGSACAVNGDVRAAHAAAIVRWSTSSGGWQCCRA